MAFEPDPPSDPTRLLLIFFGPPILTVILYCFGRTVRFAEDMFLGSAKSLRDVSLKQTIQRRVWVYLAGTLFLWIVGSTGAGLVEVATTGGKRLSAADSWSRAFPEVAPSEEGEQPASTEQTREAAREGARDVMRYGLEVGLAATAVSFGRMAAIVYDARFIRSLVLSSYLAFVLGSYLIALLPKGVLIALGDRLPTLDAAIVVILAAMIFGAFCCVVTENLLHRRFVYWGRSKDEPARRGRYVCIACGYAVDVVRQPNADGRSQWVLGACPYHVNASGNLRRDSASWFWWRDRTSLRSGEVCQVTGVYRAACACLSGGVRESAIAKGTAGPLCETCNAAVTWVLIRVT
jgi:hypothetical protein